ncbi:PREDICTED: BAI1-associated protein 3-like [Priapulus caudatus]|uniref:BAI1-associated protein 3-like n=1 Tax=Priapulus caudatus TaxID=37621 RepID=A0ABM1EJU8_PRICU|nr:PREDICTED: BAI1-associated protein 3-like [Priapulus caudatus]
MPFMMSICRLRHRMADQVVCMWSTGISTVSTIAEKPLRAWNESSQNRKGAVLQRWLDNNNITYANTVQEADGCFFESFTALSWKQENRRLRAQSEDEIESEKPPPEESAAGIKPITHIFSKKEFDLLYVEVLYTIKHKLGTTAGEHSPYVDDLYLYAREAFGLTHEEHSRLLSRASEEKPPILVINCVVAAATDLEAKDPNGFSDPYCMLGVVPGKAIEESAICEQQEQERREAEDKEQKKSGIKRITGSIRSRRSSDRAIGVVRVERRGSGSVYFLGRVRVLSGSLTAKRV